QAHEEFTLNLEVLPYGILVFHEKAIVGINEHLAKLVKRTKKELLLLSLPDLIFSEDLEKLSDNSANSEKHDVRLIDCDGNKIWCEIKVVNDLYRGSPATFFYINELTQQKINENTLNILMKRMAQAEESESFESMVVSLTEVLGFYYAFIGMYDEDTDEITIRAMSIANKLQDPFAYSVVDTPCGDVIRNGSLEIGLDTQCAYPEDHYLVEWDVDAYIGVALKNGDGKTIGHLAVMDTKPIENPSFVTSLLSFFSYRLGVKMEHELQQHELERSEKRYKCLFNDSFEAKVIYDRNISKIIEANDAAVRLFQYSKEAFKNMPISFIKPEKLGSGMMTVDQVRNNLKALDEGKKVHTETLSKRSDGTVFPTDITLSIFGTDKNLVIVSYRDMTEKKEAQRALEISEKRFRSLFEYSFDAIFLMNLETYIYENCNIRAIELFKYPKEKLLTMSPKDLVAPKQRDEIDPYQRVMENIQSLKNQKRLRFEFNFLKSNGEVFEAEVSLLPIINEHKTYCITTIKDISGKKRQEEALNRRKLFLRKVIDLNPNLIFSKDHQGKFTVANRATGEFLGVESTELIGKHWKQFYVVKEEADLIAK
ncbi:MAG: PAS domain S-box protein, partial [Bacteroidota bacterium]